MTYLEFVEQVKSRAQSDLGYDPEMMEFFPEGYSTEDPTGLTWVRDTNKRYVGVNADSLLTDILLLKWKIGKAGVVNMQRVAIRKLYEDSQKEGFEAAFGRILKVREGLDASQINEDALDKRASAVYEDIRDQLILRPLNYRLHREDLEGHVYRRVGDFVLALYQLLGDANKTLTTSKIKKSELERWGMADQVEKIMQDALENTARLFPPCVCDQRTQKEVNFLTGDFTRKDITHENSNMILLSTMKTTNGAVALFYPGVIEKMMKIMGGSFVAVFMNINDVMIFSRSDPRASRYADLGSSSGKMGEMLSRKYYLCSEKGVVPA